MKRVIFKISIVGVFALLFFITTRSEVNAQLCPYNYCSGYGTAQDPHGIGSFRGGIGLGPGGGFDGQGWSAATRERGQPFEVAVVSNFNCSCNQFGCWYDPNGPPFCAYYAGACNAAAGFFVGCGSRAYMRVERSGGGRNENNIMGTAAVYDTTPTRWNTVYRWDTYGQAFLRGDGADFSTGRYDFGNYLQNFGYEYAVYDANGRVRSPSGNSYSTSGCWNCDISYGFMRVRDHRPSVSFPNMTFCSGQPMDMVVRIADQDGIDDISDVYVNFNLRSGGTATVQFENSTAQRYNSWRWNQSANYRLDYRNTTFNNNLTYSTGSMPSGTGGIGALRFTIDGQPGFDLETDILSVDAVAYDAQYSQMEDEARYGSGNFIASNPSSATPTWIDSPQGSVRWTTDPLSYPSPGNVEFYVDDPSDITGCRLEVTGSGCQAFSRNYTPAQCGSPSSPVNISINTRSGTGSAQCTARLTLSSSAGCGDVDYTDSVSVQYAQPWMMTLYGDTYAYSGYDGMELWETSYADFLGHYSPGDSAYFSSYLLAQRQTSASAFPSNPSLRGYTLRFYTDNNRYWINNEGLSAHFESLVRANESGGCAGVYVDYDATTSDLVGGCGAHSSREIYFHKGPGIIIPGSWNQATNPSRACIVFSESDIEVDEYIQTLDGYFFADGTFETESAAGTGTDNQLIINGGVVAGRVNFQRDLPNNSTDAAEIIMHDPKYTRLFNSCLGEPHEFKVREYEYGLLED